MCENNFVRDFLAKTTVVFEVAIISDNQVTNPSGTVSFKLINSVGTTVLNVEASEYIDGIARFELTPTQTDVEGGQYDYEIIWADIEFEYAWQGTLNIKDRK